MALPKEDELYAVLDERYNQALARRGGGSPALNKMQRLDPAINPPPAPRNVTPAALTATPASRPGALPAGRQGGPAPLPAIAAPRPAPRPVAAQPGVTHVGRAGMPAQVLQAGTGRGAATTPPPAVKTPAAPTGGFNLVNANAQNPDVAGMVVPPELGGQGAQYGPGRQNALATPPALAASGGMYRTLTGPAAKTALNSDNAGSATIQGRFPNKDGTRGPKETRAYTQGGIADAGKRANVVPGLFSGISLASDQALSDARFAAAKRGDFAAVERSYADTPEKKAAYNQQAAETKVLNAVGRAPLSQLPQVAQAVTGIGAGRTAAATGAQTLQKGEAELQKGQEMQSMLAELHNLDPNKPDSKARGESIIQQILLGQEKYTQPVAQKSLGYGVYTNPTTGATVPYSKDTGVTGQQGGGLAGAQPTPAHIGLLQQNADNPDAVKEFEARYGPGSAAMYLAPKA